jgi:hypothetical protein
MVTEDTVVEPAEEVVLETAVVYQRTHPETSF